ncbi:MAG TPA: histidine kinase dimerization/phospho-acceptor domain-containing protein [Pedobacter sp.]
MTDYNIPAGLIPDDDVARLRRLEQFEILNTAPETDFDKIALLAAEIFETRHGYISFINKEDVFIKAGLDGFGEETRPRMNSLSALSILKQEPTVYHDIFEFPEPAEGQFLSGAENLSFFAAAPIITADGFALGTISVTDDQPHPGVSDRQLKMLQLLAGIVMEKLETRLFNRKLSADCNNRMHRLVHDLKNPVTSISLYAQLLGNRELSPEKVFSMAAKIEGSARVIENKLNGLLEKN